MQSGILKIIIDKNIEGKNFIKCDNKIEILDMTTKEFKGSQAVNILNYQKGKKYKLRDLDEKIQDYHICMTPYKVFKIITEKTS